MGKESRTFGYIQSPPDERDYIFGLNISSMPDEYRINNMDSVRNQGISPICAAICIADTMNWQYSISENKKGWNVNAFDVFDLREDKEMKGMIPRDALKAMSKTGVDGYKIKSYSRIMSVDRIKTALLMNGPVMACVMVYGEGDRFWAPEHTGQQPLGGHAVLVEGYDKDGFIIRNSWGPEWMYGGKTLMPFEDHKYILESWTIMM